LSKNFKQQGKQITKGYNKDFKKKFDNSKPKEKEFDASIEVRNGDVNKAIRILKKRLEKSDFQKEIAKQQYYEKPSVKRKRKKDQAKKRWNKYVRDAEQRGDFHMYQPTGTKWMKCKRKKRKHAQYKEAIQQRLRSRGVG
jgi:small subunit ribosomal protein S21